MTSVKTFLLALLTISAFSLQAQTVDEIVNKNIEAMGGAAKLTALTSIKMSGNMSAQGNDFPITITRVHMKGSRLDLDIMGTANYQILTPEKAVMFFPIEQMTEPKDLGPETVKNGLSQLDLQGPFLNYKQKGSTVELVGTEKVDNADAYHLKVTRKEGTVTNYFLDKATGRVIKTASKVKGPDGEEIDAETSFSDYKQNADGYWFAYTTTTMQGPISFDKIETNIKVDDNLFKP